MLISPEALVSALKDKNTSATNKEIMAVRPIARKEVCMELQEMIKQKEKRVGPYQKLTFINKFFLYAGLGKFNQEKDLFQKNMEEFERELMEIFCCDKNWPICLYDFTYKNRIPHYLSFRVDRDLKKFVIENHFADID